jgi:hypothetical protein
LCAETKELIAGYTFIQVKSREEALEWSKRFPNPGMKDSEIEACQLFELEDFGARRRSSAFASWGSRGGRSNRGNYEIHQSWIL